MFQIIKMLEYCGTSYKNVQAQTDEKIIFINDRKTDVQCFLRIKDATMTVTFRGSDSEKDCKADFQFWKTCVPYGNFDSDIRVHSGFIGTYKSKNVRGEIHKAIKKYNIKKVVLTGHSYGAALAVLCAVDLEYNFPKNDYEVIVFGCPRVGNAAFCRSYNLRVFKTLRIENIGDIVTMVPFSFMGYKHVGACLRIGEKSDKSFFKMPSLKAHTLQRYYSNIWRV